MTAYAESKGLDRLIRFRTGIKSIRSETQSGGWTLITHSNQKESFDAIVVANGHYNQPRLPEISGSQKFSGTITHSKNYRDPAAFASQRVMIWGTAASGQDLCREISGQAQQVFLSGHQGPVAKTPQLPNVSYHADPVKMDGHTVYLSDSTAISHIDSFIYCTGYNYAFPFLPNEIINVSDNLVSPLYKDIVHPDHPTLAFIGIPYLVIPFPLFITQAAWFAAVLGGQHELPSRKAMHEAIAQRIAAFRQKNIKPWHYHRLGDLQGPYMDSLINDYGGSPVPGRFHQLARSAQFSRLKDPDGFRKLKVSQILAQAPLP
jgi:cation diffusion facilitator CzcD-associated flavoprotein CzcO